MDEAEAAASTRDPARLARAFADRVHASPAEIEALARHMVTARRYLEYGSGGSTRLALACGIAQVTAIETDSAFRDRLAADPDLAPHLASGRLTLVHADIGPTENWGYPIAAPSPEQVSALLDWAQRAAPVDLVLIDGRYRVAATMAAVLAAPEAMILIHDYATRPHYHAVETVLRRVALTGELAEFRFGGDRAAAEELLAQYRSDVR